jgi:hypothetical protein
VNNALRVIFSPPALLSLFSGGLAGRSDWERRGRIPLVYSSLGVVVVPLMEFGAMLVDGELSAFPSCVGWPLLGALLVAKPWCLWLLLKFLLPQSKNKLDVKTMALDLGFAVMVGAICRSAAASQDWRLLFVAHHGGENGLELMVSDSKLYDLCQGSHEAAPMSFRTAVLGRPP